MKTIVCYGDSNTYGYNPENGFRYEYEERWTTILQKELKDSAIVLVVLMLGTNDLKIRFQATPTDIGKGIDRLIKMIKSITPQKRQDGQSAKILLMSPPHLGDNLVDIPSGESVIQRDWHRFMKTGPSFIISNFWMQQSMQTPLKSMPVT